MSYPCDGIGDEFESFFGFESYCCFDESSVTFIYDVDGGEAKCLVLIGFCYGDDEEEVCGDELFLCFFAVFNVIRTLFEILFEVFLCALGLFPPRLTILSSYGGRSR